MIELGLRDLGNLMEMDFFKISLYAKCTSKSENETFLWVYILVPRAYDPSGLRQESRGSGSNHFEITTEITEFCPSGLTQSSSMAHARNGCSQSSRFLPQARRIVGSGDETGRHVNQGRHAPWTRNSWNVGLWKLIIPEFRVLVLTKRHVSSGNKIGHKSPSGP